MKIETYFIYNKFFSENRAFYDIMWKKYSRASQITDENIILRMLFACLTNKRSITTHIHNI